jgi:hypothetical protein
MAWTAFIAKLLYYCKKIRRQPASKQNPFFVLTFYSPDSFCLDEKPKGAANSSSKKYPQQANENPSKCQAQISSIVGRPCQSNS